ncbi:MAG TPA: hypothetical protein VHY82_00990, partial [Acetobacteraceae bacterium]|nr:hypothetical protein [Acetobacteraceae bacterium]
MANITLTVTTSPNTLTLSGVKSLGAPADLVAVATPASGALIPLGTLSAQPDGPYALSANAPPGSYTVQVTAGTMLSSDTTVSCTVPPATLVVTGTNNLGSPATATLTATPAGGGTPIPIGTLTDQPVGPFSVTATLPPGDYSIDIALTGTLTSDAQQESTVPPTVLTTTGNNTLGVPADVVVTATPAGGGSPITLANLSGQPVGAYSVSANVPAGAYTVDMTASASISAAATA